MIGVQWPGRFYFNRNGGLKTPAVVRKKLSCRPSILVIFLSRMLSQKRTTKRLLEPWKIIFSLLLAGRVQYACYRA